MNNIDQVEKEGFSLGDVMLYSNIEITHANDNKAPTRVIMVKVVIWAIIFAMLLALFVL